MGRVLQAGDIAGEAVLLASAGRAILMQIALPPVGAGVASHSDFAHRPLSRLTATLTYSYATVLGHDADRAAVRRLVNRAHAPVRSGGRVAPVAVDAGDHLPAQPVETGDSNLSPADPVGPDDAIAYSAFDPDLQLWVAVTLYDSAVAVYESIFGPLDEASAEAVLAGFAPLGTVLQVPPGRWPASLAAYREYRDHVVAQLDVTPPARRVAHDVLHPTTPPYLRLAGPLIRLLTAGYLGPGLREAYGLPWDDRRQRRFDRLIGGLRVVYPRLPRRLRWWPCRRYLNQLRRSESAAAGERPER